MDPAALVEWAWTLPDGEKPALAARVAAARAKVDEKFYRKRGRRQRPHPPAPCTRRTGIP